MSKQTKFILFITSSAVLLILIASLWVFSSFLSAAKFAVSTDPKQVAQLASQISDSDLPTGYSLRTGQSIMGSMSIMIVDTSNQRSIWLGQATTENGLTPDEYLRQSITPARYIGVQWKVVKSTSILIRNNETILTIYSGVNQENRMYHAWASAFKGKGGPALLVIVAPEETWDEEAMQAFIASMH